MRRILLPAVLCLSAVLLLPDAARAQFTFKGGVNLVDFFGDDVAESSRRPRLAGGIGFEVFSLGPLALAPEIYYAQKGADDFQRTLAEGDPAQVSLSYVEIPALVRLALPFGGRVVEPYLAAGPVFGWQLDCSVTAGPDGSDQACNDLLGGEAQLESTLQEYEQGLMFGAGVALNVLRGIGAITVDARYARGLTRLSDAADGPEIQNRALSVVLGYRFGLGGGLGGGPLP